MAGDEIEVENISTPGRITRADAARHQAMRLVTRARTRPLRWHYA